MACRRSQAATTRAVPSASRAACRWWAPLGLMLALVVGVRPVAAGDQQPWDGGRQAAGEDREYFLLNADQQPLVLARGGLDPRSFRLTVAGQRWEPNRDYRLRSRSGVVIPLRPWCASGKVTAVATYRFHPGQGTPRIGWRPMAPAPARPDVAGDGQAKAAEEAWDLEAVGDLAVRGSKSVYVSSGTNRELTVDQNLRLNVSGMLTSDIAVNAVLTDDNLPVVPEGNTEELQDIDQVLVELVAPTWQATLGDFVAFRDGTRFGEYRRKLQGMSFRARPGRAEVEGMFGSPRGRYRTIELRGEDANQGPYFLSGGEVGRNLFIVAGSERVTVDGERLTRGQDRDYVIDYVRGTVAFTYRRLITAETLIVVEFEEGEGAYSRSVVGAGGGARLQLGGVPALVRARITREADDPGRLRSGELDEDDEAVLAAAGDDPLLAVTGGAVQVAPGEGDYIQVGAGDDLHYVYVEEGGDWRLQFFHAGAGWGDYDLANLTEAGVRVYTWVGPDRGSYRLGRQISLPARQSLFTVSADVGDSVGARLHGEWHVSQTDLNILSDLDAGDDVGRAGQFTLHSGELPLLGGNLDLRGAAEQTGQHFVPFTAARSIHDYEGWGLGERARRAGFLEQRDRQFEAAAGWKAGEAGRRLQLDVEAARLEHGAHLAAQRYTGRGQWDWAGGRGRHVWREAVSEDTVDPLDIHRVDQDHDVAWQTGPVVPRGRYRLQRWADAAVGSAAPGGYRLEEITGGLGSAPGAAWTWEGRYTRGLADSLRADDWQHQRDSRTWRGSLATPRTAGMRLMVDATVRRVLRPTAQDESTRLGRLELAGSWARLGSDWSVGYSLDNSRTEVLARQVVFVGLGEGRYDQAGNFVGEGRGDYEVALAGTDSLVATTAVRADFAWQQDMSVFGRERAWTAWTSRTQLGVEARNRTDDMGRLLTLRPAVIFDPETAVLGRVDLSEEVTLLRHLRAWDLRWRFDFRQARDRQYAQGQEDRLGRTHLVTITWNPTSRLSLRLRGEHDDERRDTDQELNPTLLGYDVLKRRGELEASWRLGTGSRLALGAELIDRGDLRSGVEQRELALLPSLRWRVADRWSLQAEWRVSDVQSDEPAGARRPFFFPTAGTNVENSTRLAWDPRRTLNFALAWFARKPGGLEWRHDLRLESTARF